MLAVAALSLALWASLLAWRARPWDLGPVAEDEPEPAQPSAWPPVCALVPARDEEALLPRTLPALLAQDYPGPFRIVVVDDRSGDRTGEVARRLGAVVVDGAPRPDGWVGKVWALEQGAARLDDAAYALLTDADILHGPPSLRRLVAESEAVGLDLNSRMALLRAATPLERLLIPPFAFFFAVLYPMRRVAAGRTAAAAGGCVLLRRDMLERIGGFASIRGEVIDDVNLARRVRAAGGRLRLATSRSTVVSLRAHDSLGAVWRMVRRTAFAQLAYSRALLALTLAALALLFAAPPGLLAAGLVVRSAPVAAVAGAAWAAMALAYLPAVRFYGLAPAWAPTLPLAGVLYAAMTLDSGLRGRTDAW